MKWFCSLLVVMIVMLASNPAGADTREVIALRQASRPMLKQERYDEAIKIYTDAATKAADDDALQAHCLTQAAQLTQDKLKDTPAALKMAAEIRDPLLAASLRLVLLASDKQYAKVLEEFGDTDISTWPLEVQMVSHYQRAGAYIKTDQMDKAVADLEAGRKIPGRVVERLWMTDQLGEYYKQKQEIDKALEVYAYGLGLTSANYAARNRCQLAYTTLLLEKGDTQAAWDSIKNYDFEKVSSDYWRGVVYLLQADIQAKLGNNGQAAKIWTKVIRLPEGHSGHKAAAQKHLEEISSKM